MFVYTFTCEITKSVPRWRKVLKHTNEDVRALEDAIENLNTGKNASKRILSVILLKNSENYELEAKT